MKPLSLLAGFFFTTTLVSAAGCLPGTLQGYVDLGAGGCQLGPLLFNNFTIATGAGFAIPIDPTLVQITPGGTAFLPTLLFTLNTTAGAGDVFESFFQFQSTGPQSGVSILLNNPSVSGDGAVTGVLDVCRNGMFLPVTPVGCSGTPSNATAFLVMGDAQLRDSANFGISSFFDVFVDLTIDGGLSGSAVLPSAAVGVTAVPEPSPIWLISAGLFVIGRRRRK